MAVFILYPSITFRLRRAPRKLFLRNFERPFTLQTNLGQPPNFGKTRFRRFPTFHFSSLKFFPATFLAEISGVKSRTSRFVGATTFLALQADPPRKITPDENHFWVCTIFGGGLIRAIPIFSVDFLAI